MWRSSNSSVISEGGIDSTLRILEVKRILYIFGETAWSGLTRECPCGKLGLGQQWGHPAILISYLLSSIWHDDLAFFSSGNTEMLLLTELVCLAPTQRPFYFFVGVFYVSGFIQVLFWWLFHMHPYLPWRGLVKCLPCQRSGWYSVLMAQTFCLSLQPLNTTGVLSSSSATSNRSRNRTRYRTKALSSEVDESLFGGIKVTLTQFLQVAVMWRQ